jgi:hypothetical protein
MPAFFGFLSRCCCRKLGCQCTAVLKEQQHVMNRSSLDPPHFRPLFRYLSIHVPMCTVTSTTTRPLDEVDGQLREVPPRSGLRHNGLGGLGLGRHGRDKAARSRQVIAETMDLDFQQSECSATIQIVKFCEDQLAIYQPIFSLLALTASIYFDINYLIVLVSCPPSDVIQARAVLWGCPINVAENGNRK